MEKMFQENFMRVSALSAAVLTAGFEEAKLPAQREIRYVQFALT